MVIPCALAPSRSASRGYQYPSDSLTVIAEGSIVDMPPDCLVGHFHTRELPINGNGVTADDAHISFTAKNDMIDPNSLMLNPNFCLLLERYK